MDFEFGNRMITRVYVYTVIDNIEFDAREIEDLACCLLYENRDTFVINDLVLGSVLVKHGALKPVGKGSYSRGPNYEAFCREYLKAKYAHSI